MSGSKVAWVQKCTHVWNTKLEAGSDGTRWCSDDQEEFLRGVEAEFKSSNMLITDCINHIKRWFSTQCAENGSMKLPEESDDEDESFVPETDLGEESEVTEDRARAEVTKKKKVEKWQPRMHQQVLSPFPIDGDPRSTMVGRKMESSAMRDDIHTIQDFEAMVVHVDEKSKTVGLNYYGIGGYHPSVRWSVLKPMTKNAADGEREKQSAKDPDSSGSQGRVVKAQQMDDFDFKLRQLRSQNQDQINALRTDLESGLLNKINGLQKEIGSIDSEVEVIDKSVGNLKGRVEKLEDNQSQGKQSESKKLASKGNDEALKKLQEITSSHEQKIKALELQVGSEVKRLEDMLGALSSNAATTESHGECLARLEKVEDMVVGGKRKLDRIYTAIRTMAEFENDVEKDTESEKDGSSVQMDEDKPEEELDGSRSPQLARRRGGGQGRGRGRPRNRPRCGLGRYQEAPAQSGAGEGA